MIAKGFGERDCAYKKRKGVWVLKISCVLNIKKRKKGRSK